MMCGQLSGSLLCKNLDNRQDILGGEYRLYPFPLQSRYSSNTYANYEKLKDGGET